MAWSTKITSHMDGAELYTQIIYASMMANSKMELNMDTRDIFGNKMVVVVNQNIKMVSL